MERPSPEINIGRITNFKAELPLSREKIRSDQLLENFYNSPIELQNQIAQAAINLMSRKNK